MTPDRKLLLTEEELEALRHEIRHEVADDFGKRILRWIKILTASVVVVAAIALTAVAITLLISSRTHDALCHFREDLGSRIAQSNKILTSPRGPEIVKSFGLTAAQVQNQVQGQQRTYDSLASLHC